MVIDLTNWKEKYKRNTATAGDELVKEFDKASGIVDKALSPAAIDAFKRNVVSDVAMKQREKNLRQVGDAGMKAAMRAKGKGAYIQNTGLAADKAAQHFAPVARKIDEIVPTMQPPGDNATQNVMNRVVPLAQGLQDDKKQRLGAT